MRKLGSLKTSNVAEYCEVSHFTVINWIKEGKLKAYSTPGGHYRVQREDFREFLKKYEMPIREEFFIGHPQRVLVVDDEPDVVEFIIRALQDEDEGWEFDSAADGFEAGLKVSTFEPDLIILDLVMPNVDGFEVCRQVKGNPETEEIKILVVTGYPEHVKKATKCGADDYMVKPLEIKELRKKARRLLK
ncbi:MAG: response regulator [Chloroflexota bacterium]|nr:response regulator [Chloroflexota bacterium]